MSRVSPAVCAALALPLLLAGNPVGADQAPVPTKVHAAYVLLAESPAGEHRRLCPRDRRSRSALPGVDRRGRRWRRRGRADRDDAAPQSARLRGQGLRGPLPFGRVARGRRRPGASPRSSRRLPASRSSAIRAASRRIRPGADWTIRSGRFRSSPAAAAAEPAGSRPPCRRLQLPRHAERLQDHGRRPAGPALVLRCRRRRGAVGEVRAHRPLLSQNSTGNPDADAWEAWWLDFFQPAGDLLTAAPWVFARGNHELCSHAGPGWFYFLDASSELPEAAAGSSPARRRTAGGRRCRISSSSSRRCSISATSTCW